MKRLQVITVIGAGILGVLSISLPPVASGKGAGDDHRRVPYIIFSEETSLKAALGLRHVFPGKFTAVLTLDQVDTLNAAGTRTERVRLFHPTKPEKCSPWPECKNGGGGGDTTTRPATPSDQTPWGIETIYNDASINATIGGANVNVAVLDTGVMKDHLDLVQRVAQCVDFTGGGPPGTVKISESKCADKNGHGTHVAGTILGDGGADGLGIYGIAPDASLFAYKVCGGGGCWGDDIAAAIDYAGSNGAHIVSLSLGGDSESSLIKDAIARNLHLLIIAAAGNDGPNDGSIDYPGANQHVVAVGAINVNIQVPSWSSRGINDGDYVMEVREVWFGAPGVSVESTWNDGGYRTISGTSMATPHVSGLAAKIWQGDAAGTRSYLQNLATDIWTVGDDTATGLGLPQAP